MSPLSVIVSSEIKSQNVEKILRVRTMYRPNQQQKLIADITASAVLRKRSVLRPRLLSAFSRDFRVFIGGKCGCHGISLFLCYRFVGYDAFKRESDFRRVSASPREEMANPYRITASADPR
jgi:hypothetical protein